MRELDMLDSLDVNALARYSSMSAEYSDMTDSDKKRVLERNLLQHEEKLGITPTARARLAKKKAERQVQDEFELLLDDVTDYVNQDNV